MMNEYDIVKVKTAVMILLSQNNNGLSDNEIAEKIGTFSLGIRQSRGSVTRQEIAAILKGWNGYGRAKIKRHRDGVITYYSLDNGGG